MVVPKETIAKVRQEWELPTLSLLYALGSSEDDQENKWVRQIGKTIHQGITDLHSQEGGETSEAPNQDTPTRWDTWVDLPSVLCSTSTQAGLSARTQRKE